MSFGNTMMGMMLAVSLGLAACADSAGLQLTAPDRAVFESAVYPVLLRDCGFHECHGSSERFFQVFGPGRGRLDPATQPLDEVTAAEVAHSYERASSMLDAADIDRSLLLRKPLAVQAGGTGHEGVDALGRNVYQSTAEPDYAALVSWAKGPANAVRF